MTDLFNMLASYLHDVFVIKFDGWVILGFVAQGFFTMRFVVQWIASERARASVIPVAFWFFSIGGGVLLLIYALYRKDPVFIAGQALGFWSTSAICISSSSTDGRRRPDRSFTVKRFRHLTRHARACPGLHVLTASARKTRDLAGTNPAMTAHGSCYRADGCAGAGNAARSRSAACRAGSSPAASSTG